MMKNIPNKYTQKMLLAAIDEDFARSYDFFYLPIDFKNKCNVGYAFINLLRPETIAPLAQRFNNKKWPRFNSEKVCHISYARIQVRPRLGFRVFRVGKSGRRLRSCHVACTVSVHACFLPPDTCCSATRFLSNCTALAGLSSTDDVIESTHSSWYPLPRHEFRV